jgi:hypothetical protein
VLVAAPRCGSGYRIRVHYPITPPPLTAARAEEVLSLDVADLDRANRRARTIRKGGKADDLLYDIRTARMLGQLLGRRRTGPVFLSTRRAPEGTARSGQVDPRSRRLRMTHRTTERHLGAATAGWDLHDMRHSRLTHAGEDGTTEADLMNLSGHENRRTLQRYLKPSKGAPTDASTRSTPTATPGHSAPRTRRPPGETPTALITPNRRITAGQRISAGNFPDATATPDCGSLAGCPARRSRS